MEYTILRDGKTYQEYRDFIAAEVDLLNLDAGDKAKKLAKRYKENDSWFKSNQEQKDREEKEKALLDRINKLKDMDISISLSGINEPNKAILIKKILAGDEATLELLESKEAESVAFLNKELKKESDKKLLEQKQKDLKEIFKEKDLENLTAEDKDLIIKFVAESIILSR